MSNPILQIQNAGRGETPPWPDAAYRRGAVVHPRKQKAIAHFPEELIVLGDVPPGFPAEHALADLVGEPRPLMVTKEKRYGQYILWAEGDNRPFLAAERHLKPSGKPPVEIGTISRDKGAA